MTRWGRLCRISHHVLTHSVTHSLIHPAARQHEHNSPGVSREGIFTAAIITLPARANLRPSIHHPGITAPRIQLQRQCLQWCADFHIRHVGALVPVILDRLHNRVRATAQRSFIHCTPPLDIEMDDAVRSVAGGVCCLGGCCESGGQEAKRWEGAGFSSRHAACCAGGWSWFVGGFCFHALRLMMSRIYRGMSSPVDS